MLDRRLALRLLTLAVAMFSFSGAANSAVVPFTEDFNNDAANWYNRASTAPVAWNAMGGPDGGAYVSTTLNFVEFFSAGQAPALFRAQDEFGSSSNALVGDWIADGVGQFSYWVRHDAPVSMQFFARYASPVNFPAADSVSTFFIEPNVWTQVTFPIPDPNFLFEGPFTFEDVFHNIGHVQAGLLVPQQLVGVDATYNFGFDKASIIPEPATLALLGVAGLFSLSRRAGRNRGLKRMRPARGTALATVVAMTTIFTIGETAQAVIVPFTEDFSPTVAEWRNSTGLADLTWNSTGGPDGGAYASGTFNFQSNATGDTPAFIRGHDEYGASGSSGGAFVGNWVTGGVTGISMWVRHNAPTSLSYFVRYASPSNFPGAATVYPVSVPPGQWSQIIIPLPNPSIVFEGPFTYPMVFSNIGHVQIGVSVPASMAGVNQDYTFEVDKISLLNTPVPAVSTVGLVVLLVGLTGAGAMVVQKRAANATAAV